MPFDPVFTRKAERDYAALPAATKWRVAQFMGELERTGHIRSATKLKGSRDMWRARIGDYRFLYRTADSQGRIEVAEIPLRRDAYR